MSVSAPLRDVPEIDEGHEEPLAVIRRSARKIVQVNYTTFPGNAWRPCVRIRVIDFAQPQYRGSQSVRLHEIEEMIAALQAALDRARREGVPLRTDVRPARETA